jgi:hypothetical protein
LKGCPRRTDDGAGIPLRNNHPSANDLTLISDDRAVFDLNVDSRLIPPDDWLTYRIWLDLKPGA